MTSGRLRVLRMNDVARRRAQLAAVVVRPPSFGEVLPAGALAGLVGGFLMVLWLAVRAYAAGAGVLFPLRMIGAAFIGPKALVDGATIVLWGTTLHVLTSIAFGIVFARVLPRSTTVGVALVSGFMAGMFILVLMTYAVLPLTNATMGDRVHLVQGSWFFAHFLYGLGLAAAPVLRRHFHREPAAVLAFPGPNSRFSSPSR